MPRENLSAKQLSCLHSQLCFRRAFPESQGPYCIIDFLCLSLNAKRSMRQLLRAKGGKSEDRFAKQLAQHDQFLASLRRVSRAAIRRLL